MARSAATCSQNERWWIGGVWWVARCIVVSHHISFHTDSIPTRRPPLSRCCCSCRVSNQTQQQQEAQEGRLANYNKGRVVVKHRNWANGGALVLLKGCEVQGAYQVEYTQVGDVLHLAPLQLQDAFPLDLVVHNTD